jgi:ABC-type transport system involved in cytochrome c biogenesis permease subunit
MTTMIRSLTLLLLFAASSLGAETAILQAPAIVDSLPVLHQQRIKPFAVAAEEIVLSITGKPSFGLTQASAEGLKITRKFRPVDLTLDLMLHPDAWRERPLLYVPYRPLQEQLKINGQWISLAQLAGDPAAQAFVMQAVQKKRGMRQSGEVVELTALDQAAIALAERQAEAEAVLAGTDLALCPENAGDAQKMWLTIDELALRPEAGPGEQKNAPVTDAAKAWGKALREAAGVDATTAALISALRSSGIADYPSDKKVRMELMYRKLCPFTWASLLYIAGGLVTALGMSKKAADRPRFTTRAGIALTFIAILCTVVGLGIRVAITDLGAVTNLYETLIYVSLIVGVLGLIFAFTTRNPLYVVAAGIGAGLCAMVGEAIPPELGQNITQLQPVLRSRFWLWIHVKTVVASYGAFLLALAFGNIVLAKAAIQRRAVQADEARSIYRALQVGVVLIAAGTLLGAFWAAEAWGRFWGWDPKEVWALVILLTYLIPLHLRYAGVVGPTGLAAWSVYGFLSVVMSWYGVNFILGTGLHAYAFGSGGQMYVLPLCALQIVVTTAELIRIKSAAGRQK